MNSKPFTTPATNKSNIFSDEKPFLNEPKLSNSSVSPYRKFSRQKISDDYEI
jgi:hypothetical protein